MTDRRLELARHEAAHVVVAAGLGATARGVWLSESNGGVASVDDSEVTAEGKVEIALGHRRRGFGSRQGKGSRREKLADARDDAG